MQKKSPRLLWLFRDSEEKEEEYPCTQQFGVERSLVEYYVREVGVGGSNPLTPTIEDRVRHRVFMVIE